MHKNPLVRVLAIAIGVLITPGLALAGHAQFNDVSSTHRDGIHWLANTGITSGCSSSRFCSNDAVTRAQMATFMHRLSGQAAVEPVVDAATVQGMTPEELQGSSGVGDILLVTEEVSTFDTVVTAEVYCPRGMTALSGGGFINDLYYMAMNTVTMNDAGQEGWTVLFISDDYQAYDVSASVFAHCVEEPAGGSAAAGESSTREPASSASILKREAAIRQRISERR